jgi:ornithine cyclodeaminase
MLTNVRTAAAGATAAKHLAAPNPGRIAVLGGGVQARMQVEMLARVTTCRDVSIWARRAEAAETLGADLARSGFRPTLAASPADAVADADIIVTATAATTPLISRQMLKPGAHVTAVGSDTHDKQELDVDLLAEAIVVADSKSQCRERGEIHHALAAGLINEANIVELGAVIAGLAQGRTHADQITVADLTGVAVQDIAMAKAVLARLGDA